jgi:hypothetical protein
MLVESWHHWLLLRPLLVFALAGPLLVSALLFRGRDQPRGSERRTEDASIAPSADTDGHIEPGSQQRVVEASLRQWRVARVESDRRAA